MELGDFESAIEEYKEALRIRKACVGNEIDKKASYGFIKGRLSKCSSTDAILKAYSFAHLKLRVQTRRLEITRGLQSKR